MSAPDVTQPPRTGLLKRLAFTLAPLLILLVTAEIVLRLAGVSPRHAADMDEVYSKFQPDAELIWTLKKNWRGLELNGSPVETDAFGLRATTNLPPAGVRPVKILFLGDSVTYGHFLPNDATIPSRVSHILSSEYRHDIQMHNAGVPGYSTFQAAALFRRLAPALAPNLVVLGFCLNDVTERYATLARYGGMRFFMGNVDTEAELSAFARAWRSLALRRALLSVLQSNARRQEEYRVERLWETPDATHIQKAWDEVFAEIVSLKQSVDAAGARLAVVIYPFAAQIMTADATSRPQQVLTAFLSEQQIAHLDLLPGIAGDVTDPASIFMDADHFNPSGSTLVATAIARFLDRSHPLRDGF